MQDIPNALHDKQTNIVYENLKKSLSNYADISLPKYTKEQLDEIVKSGDYEIFSTDQLTTWLKNISIKKAEITEELQKEYTETWKNIEKAIYIQDNGDEVPVFFYKLTEMQDNIIKSEDGEDQTQKVRVYSDNSINRSKERVGEKVQS